MKGDASCLAGREQRANRAQVVTGVDYAALKQEDLSLYLKHHFLPIKKVGNGVQIGVVGTPKVNLDSFKEKFHSNVETTNIDRQTFVKILQKRFSKHILHRATYSLAKKQPKFSAMVVLSSGQKKAFLLISLFLLWCFWRDYSASLNASVFVCNVIFFINSLFKIKLFYLPKEKKTDKYIPKLKNKALPVYSLILPLYREKENTVKGLLRSISNMDYPKSKLDVKIVVEQFDRKTLSCLKRVTIPSFAEVICVQSGKPKTKPKACNYALKFARGKYVVIFDAEDRPEPKQLKKAVYNFGKLSKKVICLQATINFYNKRENILTRFMSVEYRLWFNRFLVKLDRMNAPIPLGGTSNHFKAKELRKIGGWDSFNVTEDADLGIRLYKRGYKAKMFDSITLEESPTKVGQWIKQRSRWIKGHIQTYLVHLRSPRLFFKNKNYSPFFNFNLFLIVPVVSFLYPLFLILVAAINHFEGIREIKAQTQFIWCNAALWLLFCWVSFFIMSKQMSFFWRIIVSFLSPCYFAMHSIAAVIACLELVFKPHYWHKTTHNYKNKVLELEPQA